MSRRTVKKYAKEWNLYNDSRRSTYGRRWLTASPVLKAHLEAMVEDLKSPEMMESLEAPRPEFLLRQGLGGGDIPSPLKGWGSSPWVKRAQEHFPGAHLWSFCKEFGEQVNTYLDQARMLVKTRLTASKRKSGLSLGA